MSDEDDGGKAPRDGANGGTDEASIEARDQDHTPHAKADQHPFPRDPDEDAEILAAIALRAQRPGGLPDADALEAMHEPLRRVMEGAMLFYDLAWAVDWSAEIRREGLVFLTAALQREAERLYRLYHGSQP